MPRGRARSFDTATALDRAVDLFWEHGYDGTSIADLTSAMGINAPSLYSAFGSKEALFSSAIEHYVEEHRRFLQAVTAEPTARDATERLLYGTVERSTRPHAPAGSLTVKGMLACSSATDEMRAELTSRHDETRVAMSARFERAVSDHDLPSGTDCGALAAFVAIVCDGIAVEAVAGLSRAQLSIVASTALLAIPHAGPDHGKP